MEPTPSFRPAGTLNVATALAPYTGPWDPRLAAHLLRRAGFGGSPADVARLGALTMNGAVDAMLDFSQVSGLPDQPAGLPDTGAYLAMIRETSAGVKAGDPAADMRRRQATSVFSQAGNMALQRWWLARMVNTQAPLQEKMTLFWHGHFTSEVNVKGIYATDMLAQNQLFRSMALGNVRALTEAVARDPAMLKYLDGARNEKAHPNENFARELMELFTLGIGNYTEQDIRESARAFTGWTVYQEQFYSNPRQHDDGVKTFLGRTGNFTGSDIVDIIFQQPAAARWFASKLLNFYVYNDPEPALIDAVAAQLRHNGYELKPVLSTLLRSNVFYSPRAYRALVKSPVEFVAGSYRLYGLQPDDGAIAALRKMGQIPFHPPNVKGWDGGLSWINSQTLIARENFLSSLMTAKGTGSWLDDAMPKDARDAAQRLSSTILQDDLSPAGVARLVAYLDGEGTAAGQMFSGENYPERIRGAAYLAMATPAYQLN